MLQRFAPRALGWLLVGLGAVVAGAITALDPVILQRLELGTQGLFFRLRGAVLPPSDVVILAIDDDSLRQGQSLGKSQALASIQTWPWRRSAYAAAIDRVMRAGAKSVAVGLVLDQPSDRPQDDLRLQQVLQRYGSRVTLAGMHATSDTNSSGLEQMVFPAAMFRTRSLGLINYLPEVNESYRRFPSAVYPAQITPELHQSQIQFFAEAALQAAGMQVPPPQGDYIFFYGPQNTFRTVPFWHVLYPQNWQVLQEQQVFKDKIVLIGSTATDIPDAHPTPFGKMSGVEIHANAIATLLERRALEAAFPDPHRSAILVMIGVLIVGFSVTGLSPRPLFRFILALGLGGAWVGLSFYCFVAAGLILPVVVPTVAMGLVGVSYLSSGAFGDRLEKFRLRRTLARYVSAPVMQEILSQPEGFRSLLRGRKLKAAVLFCDIRGFTTLSCQLPAEELVLHLNVYLNAMVGAIAAAGGTVDKFIGDAVMAEFGSPVSQGEAADAINAIRAALGMRQALVALRAQWRAEGKPPLFNGIGISYGEVIAGNIGSVQRLEYTVIGDTVNVASRVEGLTKKLWTDILITESLYELVKEQVHTVFVGEHLLKGREGAPSRLYSVVCLKGEVPLLYKQVREELRQHMQQGRSPDFQGLTAAAPLVAGPLGSGVSALPLWRSLFWRDRAGTVGTSAKREEN